MNTREVVITAMHEGQLAQMLSPQEDDEHAKSFIDNLMDEYGEDAFVSIEVYTIH